MDYVSITGINEQAVLSQIFDYVVSSNSNNSPTEIKLTTSSLILDYGKIDSKTYEKLVGSTNESNFSSHKFIDCIDELLSVNNNISYFKGPDGDEFSHNKIPIAITVLSGDKVISKYSFTEIEKGTSWLGGYHFHRGKIKKALLKLGQKIPFKSSLKKSIKTHLKSIDDTLQECIDHPFYANLIINSAE